MIQRPIVHGRQGQDPYPFCGDTRYGLKDNVWLWTADWVRTTCPLCRGCRGLESVPGDTMIHHERIIHWSLEQDNKPFCGSTEYGRADGSWYRDDDWNGVSCPLCRSKRCSSLPDSQVEVTRIANLLTAYVRTMPCLHLARVLNANGYRWGKDRKLYKGWRGTYALVRWTQKNLYTLGMENDGDNVIETFTLPNGRFAYEDK